MAMGSECGVTTHIIHLHQLVLDWDNSLPMKAMVLTGRLTELPPQHHPP